MTGKIDLAYGSRSVEFSFDEDRFSIISANQPKPGPLSDFEVGALIDTPIDSDPLDELVTAGDSVLIVVSDATRATASAQIVNLLVRRLVQVGVSPERLAIIFATGIHRPVSEKERVELLSPFIVQRLQVLDHDAHDSSRLTTLGKTDSGVTVAVNKALLEFSTVILTGGVSFHYFAGFTGGRKSICPGLASAETIDATHMLALAEGGRAKSVGAGRLDGNPVHEECERVAQLVAPAFGVNTIVDESKKAVSVFSGDWRLAHRAACDHYLEEYSAWIPSKRDVVVTSCGGLPHDINLIQAHKALDMASLACNDGGTIILLAECRDGLGRADFLKWFGDNDSRMLAARLSGGYEVNGQTAWALMSKAERFRVCLVSELSDDDVERMRMIPVSNIAEGLESAGSGDGFIMPRGAAVLPRISK